MKAAGIVGAVCGGLLLIAIVAFGLFIVYMQDGEVCRRDMVPSKGVVVREYENATFGSTIHCVWSRISHEDVLEFATVHGYDFKFVEQLNLDWSFVGGGVFDGLSRAKRGSHGFYHCVARDGKRRLRSGAFESRLEFVYDVEKEALYSFLRD